MQILKARTFGKDKAFAFQAPTNARLVVTISIAIGIQVVVPEVRYVLQEQHHENVVLVLAGIDDAPEGVTCRPRGLVDLLLGNPVRH